MKLTSVLFDINRISIHGGILKNFVPVIMYFHYIQTSKDKNAQANFINLHSIKRQKFFIKKVKKS